jgi:hypothetical protein
MRVSTTPIAVPRAFAVAPVALFLLVAATGSGPATAQPGSLAGVYDGGQMEIAAALELKPNGRFNYALSYGALKALHDLAELTTSILETFEAHCKESDDKIAKLASVKSGRAGDGKVLLIGSTKPASGR